MEHADMAVLLLRQAANLLSLRDAERQRTGEDFNIFVLLGLEYRERDHCRFLYELLRPDGAHGMGDAFLREFFRLVLKRPYPEASRVRVYREYAFSGEVSGQIDLLIEGPGFCFPIEVKIGAADQPLQLRRYSRFAAERAADSRVYYLTLRGDAPSEYGTGGRDVPGLVRISFAREVRAWLARCREMAAPVVSGLLRQYIAALDALTGYNEGDVFMDMIQSMVETSRESYESAAAIEAALKAAREDMLRRVFEAFKAHIGDRYEPFDACENYDLTARGACPYLEYVLERRGDSALVFCVGADWQLYFSLAVYGTDGNYSEDTDHIDEWFRTGEWERWPVTFGRAAGGSWWRLLLEATPLDFRKCDGAYPELFDPERHGEIMRQVFDELDGYLAALKEML